MADNFFEGLMSRLFSGFSRCAGLSLAYLLWSFLSASEAHAGLEYGFSLLAAFGAAGCLGYFAAHAYWGSGRLHAVFAFLGSSEPLETRRSGVVLVRSADWPLLVALLFGPFVILLSGLGGWV